MTFIVIRMTFERERNILKQKKIQPKRLALIIILHADDLSRTFHNHRFVCDNNPLIALCLLPIDFDCLKFIQLAFQSRVSRVKMTIFAYILLFLTAISEIWAAKCIMDEYNWCSFTNIHVTAAQETFEPTFDYPYLVEKVRFYDSHVEILTEELCTAFHNLRELEVWNVKLQKIEVNALDNCLKLRWVSFWSNDLRKLDVGIFRNNQQLETISFQTNQLKSVNADIFNGLEKLRELSLNDNYIKTFPAYEMPFLDSLEKLYVDSNELTDIDEHEILYKFPNLRFLYLNDNPFMCDRLRPIMGTFRRNSVTIRRVSDETRLREAKLKTFHEGDCLSEEIFSASRLKQEIHSLRMQLHQKIVKQALPETFNRFVRTFQDAQKDTDQAIIELNLDINEILLEIKELRVAVDEVNTTLESIQQKIHATNVEISDLVDEYRIVNATQEALFRLIDGLIEESVEDLKKNGGWPDELIDEGDNEINIS